MIVKMQKVKLGGTYVAYRITIPKSLVDFYNLKNLKFIVEYKNGKLILTPVDTIKKVKKE